MRFKDKLDSLEWGKDRVSSMYISHTCYKALVLVEAQAKVWKWSKIWIIKVPKKSRILLWLTLRNRFLTWDLLQKWGKHGPNIWYLCRGRKDNIAHVVIKCHGGILFILDGYIPKFKEGLGPRFNNVVGLMALRCLLKLTIENYYVQLHVFGDSYLLINWMKVDLHV